MATAKEACEKLSALIESGDIPPDEPVFIIRGSDRGGASIVREWARLAYDEGTDIQTSVNAMRVATAMDQWPVKRVPGS